MSFIYKASVFFSVFFVSLRLSGSPENSFSRCFRTFDPGLSDIRGFDFSPRGDSIAFVDGRGSFLSRDNVFSSLDNRNFNRVSEFIFKHGAHDIKFSPDGKFILVCNDRGWLGLLDNSSFEVKNFKAWNVDFNLIDFSPDGFHFIAGGVGRDEHLIYLFNLEGEVIRIFKGHSGKITRLKYSPDGKSFISGSTTGTINIWTVDGELLKTVNYVSSAVSLLDFPAKIVGLDFSSSGKFFMSCDAWGEVKQWTSRGVLSRVFQSDIEGVDIAEFNPNGQDLLMGGSGKVEWWSSEGHLKETFNRFAGLVKDLNYRPDGDGFLALFERGGVKFWFLRPAFQTNPSAIANIFPTVGKAPFTVFLDGLGSHDLNDRGHILDHVWKISDGRVLEGGYRKLKFKRSGVYTVTLTVTNRRGNSETSFEKYIFVD